LKTQQSPRVILDLYFWKTWSGKSHGYGDVTGFEKLCFQNVFVYNKTQIGVFKLLQFEERFGRNQAAFLNLSGIA